MDTPNHSNFIPPGQSLLPVVAVLKSHASALRNFPDAVARRGLGISLSAIAAQLHQLHIDALAIAGQLSKDNQDPAAAAVEIEAVLQQLTGHRR